MVYYDLLLRVVAENISVISVEDTDYQWYMDCQCACGTAFEAIFRECDEVEEDEGNIQRNVNYSKKCKECKRQIYITVYNKSTRKIKANDKLQVFFSFDFRNCTPVTWKPAAGLSCLTDAETAFNNVELNEDWAEYDETGEYPLNIEKHESQFVRNNNK